MVICNFEECSKKAAYGIKQFRASKCKEHKENQMVYGPRMYCQHLKRKNRCNKCESDNLEFRCSFDMCKKYALYGFKGNKKSRYKTHKECDMVTSPMRYCKHNIIQYTCVWLKVAIKDPSTDINNINHHDVWNTKKMKWLLDQKYIVSIIF